MDVANAATWTAGAINSEILKIGKALQQGLVRGIYIIVFKPARKQRHHRFCIWPFIAEYVIPFECFDEGFRHAVALGATPWIKKYVRDIPRVNVQNKTNVNFAQKAYTHDEYTRYDVIKDFKEDREDAENLMVSHGRNIYAGIKPPFLRIKRFLLDTPLNYYPQRGR